MKLYLLVALGGALGSVARFWLNAAVSAFSTATMFPWGTFIANVTGSFVIGFFYTFTAPGGRLPASNSTRDFFMAGICGGYTTYSSFSLQTLHLAREGAWLRAGTNTFGTLIACFVAVWLGHLLASCLNPVKAA
jgi:CrcB protein